MFRSLLLTLFFLAATSVTVSAEASRRPSVIAHHAAGWHHYGSYRHGDRWCDNHFRHGRYEKRDAPWHRVGHGPDWHHRDDKGYRGKEHHRKDQHHHRGKGAVRHSHHH